MTDFARVTKYSFSLILGNVKLSFLISLKLIIKFINKPKSNNFDNFVFDSFGESLFTLSQSVTNFSSLLMTSDITEGFLLPYNKLVSSAK